MTESRQTGAVVNLCHGYRPKLTIDRRRAVDWDQQHASKLLRDNVEALVRSLQWLTFEWLWDLEQSNPDAAARLWTRLVTEQASLELDLAEDQHKARLPIAEIGCYYPDNLIYSAARRNPSKDKEKKEVIMRIKHSIPSRLLTYRVEVLSRHGVELPDWLDRGLRTRPQGPRALAPPQAGDALVHSTIGSFKGENAISRVLIAAHKLHEPAEAILERLQRYAPLGVPMPELDPGQLAGSTLTSTDLRLLSSNLNGRDPWLKDKVSAGHLIRAVESLDQPAGAIVEQLQRLARLGLEVPNVDPEQVADLVVTKDDLVLMSKDLDGRRPWLEDKFPAGHLLRAAAKLNQPLGTILLRVGLLAAAGLEVPHVDPEQVADLVVTKDDLVLMSKHLDGRRPWLEEKVPAGHLLRAAAKLNQPVGTILVRIRPLAAVGLEVPHVDPEQVADLVITKDDLVLMSKDLDGRGPWLEEKVPASHLLRAAAKLNQPVGTILVRIRPLAAVGLEVPHVDPEQVADLVITKDDLVLISENLNGRRPWLEEKVPASHLLRAAAKLNQPVGTILLRIRPLAAVGLEVPHVDPEQVADLVITKDDLVLISENLNGRRPWLEEKVPAGHLLRAAAKLNQPVGTILVRIRPLAAVGLEVPHVDPEQVADLAVTEDDLLLMSRNLNGIGPWFEDVVSGAHIAKAAKKLGQPTEAIHQRLRTLGLRLPEESSI